jgi:hypothetical protein
MLPAIAGRFNPALSIMQSITGWQGQAAGQPQRGQQSTAAISFFPTQVSARANAAINDIFSVNYVTPTELLIRMVEKTADFLNDKLSDNADKSGDTAAESTAKEKWRDTALISNARGEAADGKLKIPKVGEDGVTFRDVAQRILDTFNESYLSTDRELKKALESMTGFRLNGMTVTDLLKAAVDPKSESAEKVESVLTNILAGQKGSKVSQRLERTAKGPQSAGEAIADAVDKSPLDTVDSDTIAEDRKAIAAAIAHDKLESIILMQEHAAKANAERSHKSVTQAYRQAAE